MVCGIVKAIGKHVGSNERACIHHHIGVDEPGNLRVIVPALEIIEPRLGVVIIPPIAVGIPRWWGRRGCRDGKQPDDASLLPICNILGIILE